VVHIAFIDVGSVVRMVGSHQLIAEFRFPAGQSAIREPRRAPDYTQAVANIPSFTAESRSPSARSLK
jgi:hypothetical protein